MTGRQRRTGSSLAAAIFTVAIGVSCAPSVARQPTASPAASAPAPQRARTVDHLTPVRDSIGRAPSRFSWTAIDGAQEYSIGVWNEVDQMVWRQDHILATSVDRPEEIRLEPGTYFWSISALQDGQEVAASGMAAFVVRTIP